MGEQDKLAGAESDAQWDTIAIYEQIRESNPEDADALAELFRACLAVGESVRAYGYGASLGRAALKAGDPSLIRVAYELLSPHAAADAALRTAVDGLAAQAELTSQSAVPGTPTGRAAQDGTRGDPARGSAPDPVIADASAADMVTLVSTILENMPDDRESLELLAGAYLTLGDAVQAASTLSRLTDILILDQDIEEAVSVRERLEALQPLAPDAKQAVGRLTRFLNRAPKPPASAEPVSAEDVEVAPLSLAIDASRRRAVLADEMELLWDLQQQGLVSESQYAGVVRDLTELTSSDSITTISALHGLSFRGLAGLEALLIQLATKASTPVITLGGFDLQPAVFGVLPLDYLTFQGVIPFERLGDEALVAVLNPFSQRLRRELAQALRCPCHFFMIAPGDFDTALEVVKNRYKAA